jgi:hypothetical protein
VIAWGVAIGDLILCVVSLLIWVASPLPLAPFDAISYIALPLAFGGVGAVLTARVPGNPIGPLLLVATTGFTALIAVQSYVGLGIIVGQMLPGAAWAGVLGGLLWIPSLLVVLIGIPLVFPDGHFLSPRWRWVVIATVVVIIPVELKGLASPEPVADFARGLRSPMANADLYDAVAVPVQVAGLLSVPILVAGFASLVIRYRRTDDIGRHQIRWLAAAVTVAVLVFPVAFSTTGIASTITNSIGLVAIMAMPIAIGIAVARYRFYEIDRLISRGISCGLLTLLLVAVYATAVIVLTGPLGGLFGEGTVPVALSTLIVAALFQPIRRRVQRIVDRRFDRARFDGDRLIAAFSERLRNEVDMDAVVSDLTGIVEASVRPVRLDMWLRHEDR